MRMLCNSVHEMKYKNLHDDDGTSPEATNS